uniref:TSA: Wollemia nobilis Ref_Wollemi_Transcript_22895_1349 transcribed RNA sequence n=1 Tax=Wollemia nobilis TaxID=56998 RepID=A0A0C9RH32_9CONI
MEILGRHTRPAKRNLLQKLQRVSLLVLVGVLFAVPLIAKPLLLPYLHYFMGVFIPRVRDSFSGWLTHSYLFFLLNCIILAILAISNMQHNFNMAAPGHRKYYYKVQDPKYDYHYGDEEISMPFQEEKEIHTSFSNEMLLDGPSDIDMETDDEICIKSSTETTSSVVFGAVAEEKCNLGSGSSKKSGYVGDIENNDKILASARFISRRSKGAKMSNQSSKSLKVSHVQKAREETFESVWKKITEGRHPPLARHLRSAAEGISTLSSSSGSDSGSGAYKLLRASAMPALSEESTEKLFIRGGSGARRQSSPGQDELNKRVEAFIAKVNNEMRLQKQDSLLHYMDMINRGSK